MELSLQEKFMKIENYKNLPIIILTSIGNKDGVENHSDVKLSAFINKPIKQVQLYKSLLSAFDNGK